MTRALNKLSAAFVRSAPTGKHSDGGGLWLHQRPDGGAQWFLRVPEISFLDEIMPTPFEKFCFEFVFKVPLEDVLAASQGDESTNASHAHFQRIRSALAYRASKF